MDSMYNFIIITEHKKYISEYVIYKPVSISGYSNNYRDYILMSNCKSLL